MHFVDAKTQVDLWLTRTLLAPLSDDGRTVLWEESEMQDDLRSRLDGSPASGASFQTLPAGAAHPGNAAEWRKTFSAHLYQQDSLTVLQCPELKLSSRPDETDTTQ